MAAWEVCPDDSVVALGGILQAATSVYTAKETERVEEVKRLKAELKSQREEMERQLKEVREQMHQEIASMRSCMQNTALLNVSLIDIVGVWFETNSSSRVRVTERGGCVFDNGQKNTVSLDGRAIKLEGGFILSSEKSSRKRLIWEKNGESPLEWTYEVPGGSQQITLNIDLSVLLSGCGAHEYTYKFSLIGCELKLDLARTAGTNSATAGDKDLAVYFGLLSSTVSVGESSNTLDAITCRVQVEIWDLSSKKWISLVRTSALRFEAGGTEYGSRSGITLARLRELVSPECQATLRVTLTDIGLRELSKSEAIRPG